MQLGAAIKVYVRFKPLCDGENPADVCCEVTEKDTTVVIKSQETDLGYGRDPFVMDKAFGLLAT